MIDETLIRRVALALPGAEEEVHRNKPSFRVRGRIFAVWWRDEARLVLKFDAAVQVDLTTARPEIFGLNAWSKQGWTDVHTRGLEAAELSTLLEAAWTQVVPKSWVRKRLDEEGEPT